MDVGLGDGPHEPLPLREGTYEQGGFPYALERLEPQEAEAGAGGRGPEPAQPGPPKLRMNFRSAPAVMADFPPCTPGSRPTRTPPSCARRPCTGVTPRASTRSRGAS